MAKITYNERSWAIDVISEINLILANRSWNFKAAGGESTISNEKSSLFPDVLIFKDKSREVILQGWELKMPDTPINDADLLSNAIKKAKILQRDSFILWNAKSAVLYSKNGDSFSILKTWDDINLNHRTEVKAKEGLWKELLQIILEDLNNYFEAGTISESATYEILAIDTVIDVILENIPSTSENLKRRTRANSRLDAEINDWWLSSASEYGYSPTTTKDKPFKFPTLSKVILTDWVFKIIFANIIKRYFNEAEAIESINFETSINDAKQVIIKISEECNFYNIFAANLAIEEISDTAWRQIIQLNQFLSSINIDGIEIEILHNLLQSSILAAKRKVAGQFATPKRLADLLVRLTIVDKQGMVIDPCCGTGTIINQAYLLKEEYEIPQSEIIASIWASDKHSFPIQLATLSLAKSNNIGQIIKIFRADVIDLEVDQAIAFRNPNDGALVYRQLPKFDFIVSNLPFIKSKEIKVLNPEITSINSFIQEHLRSAKSLSGKSDIFAYIPFYLYKVLNDSGRVGLILSNAWLGTDYGEIFIDILQDFFKIEAVVISGLGKWFENADIVTTLLIASKKAHGDNTDLNEQVAFCTLQERIDNIDNIKQLSDNIILKRASEQLDIQLYSFKQIEQFELIGLPWCSYFANNTWLFDLLDVLVDANHYFDFTRGERRGWNPMFYPGAGHTIEREYIKPVLRNLRDTASLTCVADGEAFCCSRSIKELEELNHFGALIWIKFFSTQFNGTGVPLTESLHKANMFWYEMKTTNMADFVANVNYDRSLFIAKFNTRSFIDQRAIGLSLKSRYQAIDMRLLHALLNSIISMFFIECLGFGRGLGALDLRETKFSSSFKILNPDLISEEQKEQIVSSFEPLTKRDRLPLEQEIVNPDRVYFEEVLFSAFGISSYYNSIRDSLLHLYSIRFAVKN